MQLYPYISFPGTCEAALSFYQTVFDGELLPLNRYEGSPMEIPEDYKQKIMHGTVQFGSNKLMACDAMPGQPATAGNISLMIELVEVFVLEETFKRLAEGGSVTMPLQDTFWGARFGMIRDKFGVNWMFNCDLN